MAPRFAGLKRGPELGASWPRRRGKVTKHKSRKWESGGGHEAHGYIDTAPSGAGAALAESVLSQRPASWPPRPRLASSSMRGPAGDMWPVS